MTKPTSFGANLRAARVAAGLTQEDVATRLGFNRTTPVSLWERSTHLPEPATIEKLAAAVGVAPAVMLADVITPYDKLRGRVVTVPLGDVPKPAPSTARELTAFEARVIDHLRRLPRSLALRFGTLVEEAALYADPEAPPRAAPDARYRRPPADTPAVPARASGKAARRARRAS